MELTTKKVIFFDGVCNLCNGFIDFVITRDKKKQIFYSSLQSAEAEEVMKHMKIEVVSGFSTIYFLKEGKMYSKSTAILYILRELSIGYRILATLLLVIPGFIRNPIYDFVAKNRYRFFGQRETCRLPSPEEKDQFL